VTTPGSGSPSGPIRVVVVMGVSGAGKTTVGSLLAKELGWSFHEGDALHPPGNVRKMSAGIPLTDDDRGPWLDRLRALIEGCLERGEPAVIACSALKHAYRRRLAGGLRGVRFVHLAGDPGLIAERLARRRGHFMRPEMLASQLAALEEPADALRVDVAAPPKAIVRTIRAELGF
jgi:gluconokinase